VRDSLWLGHHLHRHLSRPRAHGVHNRTMWSHRCNGVDFRLFSHCAERSVGKHPFNDSACTCGASGSSIVWNDKLAISYPRDRSSSLQVPPRELLVPQCSDEYSRGFGERCSRSPTRCMLTAFLPLGHQLTDHMSLLTTPHMHRLII
jgi:hypothetical protein